MLLDGPLISLPRFSNMDGEFLQGGAFRSSTKSVSRSVYAQNLWSFLDVMFIIVYWIYVILRIHGWRTGSSGQQALDVLAMGAPVLVPRLAFNLLSGNIVFLSLRAMMADFAVLTFLAAW